MRGRVGALLLAAVMVVSAGCDTTQTPEVRQTTIADIDLAGPVSLTLWHGLNADPQRKALTDAITTFNATNGKGITVTAVPHESYSQLAEKGLAAVSGPGLPDLIQAYESQVAEYMTFNAVVDLNPYLSSPKNGLDKASRDDIAKGLLETNTYAQYGNKLLSFPFTHSLFVSYQNDDLLKAAGLTTPRTWDDFEKAVIALTTKDAAGKTTRYGWAIALDASNFDAWVLSRGGELLRSDGKSVGWGGAEGLDSLKLVDRMIRGGYAYVPRNFDYQTDLAAGRLGFFMGTSSARPFIAATNRARGTDGWSITQIPQSDPTNARTVTYGPSLAIAKTTPERQLASWLFVKWLNDKQPSATFAATSFFLPSRTSAADLMGETWTKTDPQGRQAFDLIGSAAAEPNVRGWQDIRDFIFDALTKVALGTATPEDALKIAVDRANVVLKDNSP